MIENEGHTHGITDIIIGNELGKLSSNPGQDCLHFPY